MDNIQQAKKMFQDNCRHDRGYLTNNGSEGAVCVTCGLDSYNVERKKMLLEANNKANELLSKMPKGNAKIFAKNASVNTQDQFSKIFWENVISELEKM